MTGRFQRLENLDNSEDITASPEINYRNTSFYDEPQDIFPTNNQRTVYSSNDSHPIYTTDDRRRMSHTTRKPVGGSKLSSPPLRSPPIESNSGSQSPPQPQAYLPRQSPPQPQAYLPRQSPPQPQAYLPRQSPPQPQAYLPSDSPPQPQAYLPYQPQNRNQYRASAPEDPLMPGTYTGTPRSNSSNHFSQPDNPFRDSKKQRQSSAIAKTISNTASSIWSKARGQHVSHIATPLWAAPWRHQPCTDMHDDRSNTVRAFDRTKQRNRIFFHFFLQWLIPVAFCASLVGVLYAYSSKSKVTRREKYIFNAMVVGFSLCLGFAVVNGMKEYANILRWRLLAKRYRPLQEVELLLGLASQKKALRLLWVGRTEGRFLPNGTQLLCFGYLILMLALQIMIALLGLTFSVDVAIFETNVVRGDVSIANLTYFQQSNYNNSIGDPFQLQSAAINAFGVAGQNYDYRVQKNVSLIDLPIRDAPVLYTDNQTTWWYRFVDQCPERECTATYLTRRWVKASATCNSYTVVDGGFIDDYNVSYIDGSGRKMAILYLGVEVSGTTVYYSNTVRSCGDRCTTTYVVNIGDTIQGKTWRPQVFECNNTISEVLNTERIQDSHLAQLPDEQARLAAGAIGWNGASWRQENITLQAHSYDIGSEWSYFHTNGRGFTAVEVANLVMRFSMGAVAAVDLQFGSRLTTFGDSPVQAQQVNVEWHWAILLLILVPGIQFLVLLVAVAWGNAVVIRDGSFLSTASLLRPVVERLDRTGCALTSDEICEVLGNSNIAYGVRMPNAGAYSGASDMMKGNGEVLHLDVLFEDEPVKRPDLGWRVGVTMPQGRYDGLKEREDENMVKSTAVATVHDKGGVVRKRRKSF